VGTCAYMSPERFDPDGYGGKYDECSTDIWRLGFNLLSGSGSSSCLDDEPHLLAQNTSTNEF